MHRDLKTVVRRHLETTSYRGRRQASSRRPQDTRCLRDIRARLHFHIGTWYQRAFHSSGNLVPLIEALHHYVQAALAAPEYTVASTEATTQENCRIRTFIAGFTQATKTLILATEALAYWQASPVDVSWLSETSIDRIKRAANKALRQLTPLRSTAKRLSDCREAVDVFITTLSAQHHNVRAEGGRAPYPRDVRFDLAINSAGKSNRTRLPRTRGDFNEDLNFSLLYRDEEPHFTDGIRTRMLSVLQGDRISAIPELMKRASASLASHLPRQRQDLFETTRENIFDFISTQRRWPEFIQTWRQVVFLLLRRCKYAIYRNTKGEVDYAIRELCLLQLYCETGLEAARRLPVATFELDLEIRSDLLQILGVTHGYLGRFHEGRRYLADGFSILTRSSLYARRNHAINLLRRAEVIVTEAWWSRRFLKLDAASWQKKSHAQGSDYSTHQINASSNSRSLRLLLGNFDYEELMTPSPRSIKMENALYAPAAVHEIYRRAPVDSNGYLEFRSNVARRVSFLIDEAVLSLARAEELLRGTTQNAHWWYQLSLLKLRLYSLIQPPKIDQGGSSHLPQQTGHGRLTLLIDRFGPIPDAIHQAHQRSRRSAGTDIFRLQRCDDFFKAACRVHKLDSTSHK